MQSGEVPPLVAQCETGVVAVGLDTTFQFSSHVIICKSKRGSLVDSQYMIHST
jgi:hypothetical protein